MFNVISVEPNCPNCGYKLDYPAAFPDDLITNHPWFMISAQAGCGCVDLWYQQGGCGPNTFNWGCWYVSRPRSGCVHIFIIHHLFWQLSTGYNFAARIFFGQKVVNFNESLIWKLRNQWVTVASTCTSLFWYSHVKTYLDQRSLKMSQCVGICGNLLN